ncbi:MAG: ATP-binding cassette domain-containing protein [Pararhodobacter sp.]|nr:ATP-binding cassette domain-containing protein [Pararhodobacter sp.]
MSSSLSEQPATPRGALVTVRGAEKQFPALGGREMITALDGLDITISPGSFVALIGSNGAGKSTLLSVLMGAQFLDEGAIEIDGEAVTDQPSWQRSDKVAMVRQNPENNVLGGLTIEENFALAVMGPRRGLRLRRYPRAEIRANAAAALAGFGMGLEDRLDESSATLSGGQRQAIAVAMAAVRKPRLLLLDEHTAALDPKRARIVGEATTEIARQHGMTTIMVTHDLAHAMHQTDRVLMMHRGRVVLDLSGPEKDGTGVSDLAGIFERVVGEALPDRTLLAVS